MKKSNFPNMLHNFYFLNFVLIFIIIVRTRFFIICTNIVMYNMKKFFKTLRFVMFVC